MNDKKNRIYYLICDIYQICNNSGCVIYDFNDLVRIETFSSSFEEQLFNICNIIIEENLPQDDYFKDMIWRSYLNNILEALYKSDFSVDKTLIKMYYREIFGKEIYES